MPDRLKSTAVVDLTCAECRAAALEIRALGVRLLALIQLLPLPDEDQLDFLYETEDEEGVRCYPAVSLYVDVETIVYDQLHGAAGSLEGVATSLEVRR